MEKELKISDSLKENIISFLEGNLTQSQADELITWIEQDESNMQYFKQIKEIWHTAGILNIKKYDIQKGLTKIRSKIKDRDIRQLPPKEVSFNLSTLLRIAASFLILTAFGISGIVLFSNRKKESISTSSFIETSAPKGSRSLITLLDSTTVWLNADSRLRYSIDYGNANRTVFLEGEAYFKVTRDTRIPFKVNTSDISVTALGTAFNVKAYKNEETIETTLEEGQVSVDIINPGKNTKNLKPVILKSKQTAVFIKQPGDLSIESKEQPEKMSKTATVKTFEKIPIKVSNVTDTRLYTSWKDPRWIFKNEKLSSLAPKLERRYDVKIVFIDKVLEEYAFNGTLLEESLEQVLAVIRLTSPIRYEINAKQVRLYVDKQLIKQYSKLLNQ